MPEGPYYLRIFGLLHRLMKSLHLHAQRYSLTQKISLSEAYLLFLLRNGKPVEMNRIKRDLSVSGAFATSLVDRLLKHELAERQRNDKDRRKVTVVLSGKGKRYLAKLEAQRKRFFMTLVDSFKEEDKIIMEKGVSMLVGSLESAERLNA